MIVSVASRAMLLAELGIGPAAQHDGAVRPAAAGHRLIEAGGHRQHRDQHGDHPADADDDDQRGAEPLRDAAQVDEGDRPDLTKDAHGITAPPGRRRC